MNDSLGEALPKKMQEIREIYIPAYQSIGPAGSFAIAMMNQALTRAEKAIIEGDTVAMIDAYKDLCGFKL